VDILSPIALYTPPPPPSNPRYSLKISILITREYEFPEAVGRRGGGRVSPGRGGDRGYGTIGYYRVLPSDRGTPDTHGECSMVYPRGETAA
jgi:hypothetical protein